MGGKLFAPVGFDWAADGFWRLSQLPETQKQYLYPLTCERDEEGHYRYWDKGEQIWQRRITLEQFKETKFDVIVCSLAEHSASFRTLRDKYQPQAKYIRLSGNTGEQINWDEFDNFIDTTGLYQPPENINSIVMGQEFPLDTFGYADPVNHKTIKNYMNQLHEAGAYQIWQELKGLLPDYNFKMHGSGGDDGMVDGLAAIGDGMRDMSFLFQVKHHGEGFGHVIHNAYSVGRPAIAMLEFYKGKLAEHFLIDGVSAIIIDGKPMEQVAKEIEYFSQPERHILMCHNARALFEKYVDFNADFERFKLFYEKLK